MSQAGMFCGKEGARSLSSEQGEVSSFSEADNQDLIKQIDQARKLKQQHSGLQKQPTKSTLPEHLKPEPKIKRITVESALIRRIEERKLLLKDSTPENSNSAKKSRKEKKSREKSLIKEAKAAKQSLKKQHFRKHSKSKSQQRNEDSKFRKNTLDAAQKKLICQLFLQRKCGKGQRCQFSHILKDVPATNLTHFPGQGLCKYFVTGGCWKGDKCTFSHDTKKFPCKKFHAVGSCQLGDYCKYSHRRLNPEEIQSFMQIYHEYLEELYQNQGFTNLGEYYLIYRQQKGLQPRNKPDQGIESLLPQNLKIPFQAKQNVMVDNPIPVYSANQQQYFNPVQAAVPSAPISYNMPQQNSMYPPYLYNQNMATRPQFHPPPPPMAQPSMGQPSMVQPSMVQPPMVQPPLIQPPMAERQGGFKSFAALLQGEQHKEVQQQPEKQESRVFQPTRAEKKEGIPPPPPIPNLGKLEPKVEVVEDSRGNDPRVKLMRRLEEGKKNENKPKIDRNIEQMLEKLKTPPPREQPKPKSRFARVREKMAEKAKDPSKSGVDLLKQKGLI